MEKKTRLQYATEYITSHKKACKFEDILNYVKSKLELTDEQILEIIGDFFMELTEEPSIINVGDNKWTLRDKFKYEELNPNGYEDDTDDENNEDRDEEEEDGVDFEQEDENTDTSNPDAVDNEETNEEM